jgi:IrrE N-terminal-like domain
MRPPASATESPRTEPAGQTPAPVAPAGRPRRSRLKVKSPREALEIVKRYWRTAPVDVYRAAAEIGLGPVEDPGLPYLVSGLIERIAPDEWQIVVNRNQALPRRRFTVAHEIGHFIYHRAELEAADGTSDTMAYQVDEAVCPNPAIGPDHERLASAFAVNFLIPDNVLATAQAIGITDDVDLARGFNVSRAAMRIKLGLPPLRPVV